MIRHACLVGPIAGEEVVAGLPILLRQALSLQDAGIEVLILVGLSSSALRRDARVRLTLLETDVDDGSLRESPAIVARAGTIWHPGVVRRLARTEIGVDDIVAVGSSQAAAVLCGRNRVAGMLAVVRNDLSSVPVRLPRRREFVIEPRDADGRAEGTRLLLRSLDKQADGFVSRHLHRPLSRMVTSHLLSWPVSPNAMTMVAALFGLAGVLIAVRGGYWNLVAGALLFELQNVLDGCDGEIARLKHLRSRAGEWLDQIADDVLNIAFLVAVGRGLAGGSADHWAARLAWLALAAQLVHAIGLYAGLIVKAGGRGSVAALRWWVGGGTETDSRSRFLGDLTRRDFYSLLYVVTSLLNVPAVALVWHAIVTICSAVVTTIQWIAWRGPEYQPDAEGTAEPAGERVAYEASARSSR
jgi:1L-myo-inositol 1-phosphate cytidylyltransferase / CDP-L-myo-inositol myo-inositolphosphotransferase